MASQRVRQGVIAGALLAAVAAGVVVAGASRSSHQPTPAAAGSSAVVTAAAATPTATTTAQATAAPSPDLLAAFPWLATAPTVTDAEHQAGIAAVEALLRDKRPDLHLAAPVAWPVGTAGGSDYAVVSFGRERLCLVGFRPDGGTNGPACAAPAVAEDPTTPLAIFGPLEKGKGAVAVLAPTGTASVVLHSEQGAVRAPIASGFAYAASDAPAVSMTVRASDGESVRTPLYADAGTGAAFAISVQEAVRRDQLAGGASDLDAALKPAAGFAGLAVDYAADRFIRVGVAADATAAEQAELHAIVGRFPQLAREVEFVAKPLSSTDLEALMHDVERAWGNDPSFVSIGIGDGVIDVTHLTGKPLPRAVQAIVDRQPQLFRIESGSYPQTD